MKPDPELDELEKAFDEGRLAEALRGLPPPAARGVRNAETFLFHLLYRFQERQDAERISRLKSDAPSAFRALGTPLTSELLDRMREANESRTLEELAIELRTEGLSKQQIFDAYNALWFFLVAEEGEDDDLLDLLDCFVGWCAPEARILPDEPDVE